MHLPGTWVLTLTRQKTVEWALTQEWALTRDTTVLYSGYRKVNPRAALRVLNKKYVKGLIIMHIVVTAKPHSTQQVQYVLCHTSGCGEATRWAAAAV